MNATQIIRYNRLVDRLIALGFGELVTCVQNSANEYHESFSDWTLDCLEFEIAAIERAMPNGVNWRKMVRE